jgi:hypothetical protein
MPLVDQDDFIGKVNISGEVTEPVNMNSIMSREDSIMDITKAAFSQENVVGSAITKQSIVGDIPLGEETGSSRPLDTTFRFEEHIPPGYEHYSQMFAFTNSAEEAGKVREFIDQRLEAQDIIRKNGLTGIGMSMAAGIVDPLLLVPSVGAATKASAGIRAITGALGGAGVAGGAVGAQEFILQRTQGDTRPIEVSKGAVLSAMLLGGFIGGGIGLMTKSARAGTQAVIDDALADSQAKIRVDSFGQMSVESSSALRNAEGLARVNENLTKYLGGPEITRSLSLRGVTSPFGTVRKVTNDLFDHNFLLGKELAGEARGPVVERLMGVHQGQVIRYNTSIRNAYKSYTGLGTGPGSDIQAFAKAKTQGKLSFAEFDREIGKAMRRGDVHQIPEVTKIAKEARQLMETRVQRMQELGILADDLDPKTSATYFMRRYKINDIVENYDEFKGIVSDYLKEVNPGKSLDEIDDIAINTIDNILGMGDQSLALSDVNTRLSAGGGRFTKERVFLIPDERIEKFLDNRGSTLVSQYLSQSDSMIELKEMLTRNGWDTINDARKALRSEFDALIQAAPADQVTKLNKQFKSELELMNNMFKVTLGHYGTTTGADSALRTLRKYQTYRLLGGVTVSSFPDAAMPVFKHGLPSTILDGYSSMARNLKASKLAKDQLKDFGIGLELEQNTLLRNLTDPDFRLGVRQSKLERAADSLSESFGKVTLMTYWNNMHKRIAGHMSAARTLRQLAKGTKIDDKELLRLRQLGIDEPMGQRINAQFKKYGEVIDGSYVGNYHKWTDADAKKVFGQATLSDVDTTILTPSRGDLPQAAITTELGKTIFQFKSFSSTATNKLLISGMQRRDLEVLQGMIGLIGMGAATYTLKERIAGRKPKDDIDSLIIEGINRSGVTGLFGDYIMGLSNAFLGTQGTSRYAGRSIEGLFLGPSADIVKDLGQATAGLTDGEITDSDANKVKRLMPFGNLFYMRLLMQQLKDEE